MTKHRGTHASHTLFTLLVVDGIAALASQSQLRPELLSRRDRIRRAFFELAAIHDLVQFSLWELREKRFAHGCAVGQISPADTGGHAHAACRFDFVNVEDFGTIEDAEVDRLACLAHQPFQEGTRARHEIEARDCLGSKFKQPQTEAVAACLRILLNEPLPFEHAHQAVRCALV